VFCHEELCVPLKRDWLEMTWEDFSAPDRARFIVVLPIAAVEQHGPHLPLGTDAFIAKAYLARARELVPQDLAVMFLPLQTIGASDEHRGFPGTLTLSAATVIRLLTEIGESVSRAGVRKLVIANSHGGNAAAIDIVALDLRVRLGMLVVACSFAQLGYPERVFAREEIAHGIHGGDIETSIMLHARPATVRTARVATFSSTALAMKKEFKWLAPNRPPPFGWMSHDLNPAGAIGDAAAATAAKGEAAIEFGARAFVELLGEVDRFDLERLRQRTTDT
jgi:creatinine amidohydrolase